MNPNLTKIDILRRGESAQHLLSNPVALTALDDVQNDCFKVWADSNPTDSDAREFAYKLFLAVKLLRGKLQSWSDGAKLEMSNADALKREAAVYN